MALEPLDIWPAEVEVSAMLGAVFKRAAGPTPLVEYRMDPVRFAVEVLGVSELSLRWSANPGYSDHRWDGSLDPIASMLEALAVGERQVGVESGTGTGKSFGLAIAILWFVACWDGARVFTFAPKEDQLRLYAWTELRKLWPRFKARFPTATLTDLRLRMLGGVDDSWGAVGYAVGVSADEAVATKAAGMHAEHMLLIYEEMPGQHNAVIAAGEHTCTGEHNLRLGVGNPDHQHDTLHEFCTEPGTVHIRASALDHPNVVLGRDVVPGAVGPASIAKRLEKHGEFSALFKSRVRGISPSESTDALIRRPWCDEAIARYSDESFRAGKRAMGVDVANSEHGDHAAIARGLGACLLNVEDFACPDANELGRRVLAEAQADGVEGRHVGVDSVGVGAGTVNELRWRGQGCRALNGGERAFQKGDRERWRDQADDDDLPDSIIEEERYGNLRSQMWWQMRIDLQRGRIALPDDIELVRDLTTPTFETRGGKIWIESKEKLRERLGRSPDKGDAVVYWNWVRRREHRPPEPRKTIREMLNELERQSHIDDGLERIVDRARGLSKLRKGPSIKRVPAGHNGNGRGG